MPPRCPQRSRPGFSRPHNRGATPPNPPTPRSHEPGSPGTGIRADSAAEPLLSRTPSRPCLRPPALSLLARPVRAERLTFLGVVAPQVQGCRPAVLRDVPPSGFAAGGSQVATAAVPLRLEPPSRPVGSDAPPPGREVSAKMPGTTFKFP